MKKSIKKNGPRSSTKRRTRGKSRKTSTTRRKSRIPVAAADEAIEPVVATIWPAPIEQISLDEARRSFDAPLILSYRDVRGQIGDGALLLKRSGGDPSELLISSAGRTIYTHAAMAAWWHGHLMCLEMVQFTGGRAVLLSHHVERQPGRWDVFRVSPDRLMTFDASSAVQAMIRLTGTRYGWLNLAKAALSHLPFVRLAVRANMNDAENGTPPYCSNAVSRAYRTGGVDPVPFLADAATEPGDLARSTFFRYQFTLIP